MKSSQFSVLIDDISANIRNLLTAAVEKRLMSNRRIGCLLSGGLDSSLISALLVKLSREKKLPYKVQVGENFISWAYEFHV